MVEQPNMLGNRTSAHAQPVSPLPAAPAPVRRPKGMMSELLEFIWETVKVVLISLIIILPVRYFLIQPFFVKGSSMVPNFQDKQYVLVDKWTYRLGKPRRGDVIIFKYPANPQEYFIKRIIGLPGESVIAGVNNTVKIFNSRYPDGFTLDEKGYLPAVNPTICTGSSMPFCGVKVTMKENEYFVMGDNREHSSDGRFFGPVNMSFFAGLAWLRLWPLNNINFIPRTDYPPVLR